MSTVPICGYINVATHPAQEESGSSVGLLTGRAAEALSCTQLLCCALGPTVGSRQSILIQAPVTAEAGGPSGGAPAYRL